MSLLGLIKFLELITAILGSVYYKKYSHTFLRYFLFLLWFVVGVEFTMWALKHYNDIRFQNNFIYNVVTSILYIYFFLLYYNVIKTPRYKRLVFFFLVAFVLAVTINFLWIQGLMLTTPFHSYPFTIGAILLILTIGLFFVEILNTEKVLYFKKYLMFWISVGLFLYYTAIIPYIISLNFLPAFRNSSSWSFIIFTLNLMMYACFSIGFIVSKKLSD